MTRPTVPGSLLAMALTVTVPGVALAAPLDPATEAAAEPAAHARTDCLQATGSHITAARHRRQQREARRVEVADSPRTPATECTPAAGRVYTRDDIDGTGAIDLADALRSLDPGIR